MAEELGRRNWAGGVGPEELDRRSWAARIVAEELDRRSWAGGSGQQNSGAADCGW